MNWAVSSVITLLSIATSLISLFPSLAEKTRATSRSFLPHSSVFVARNIQAAATSYLISQSKNLDPAEQKQKRMPVVGSPP
jgi:hypothetical protein